MTMPQPVPGVAPTEPVLRPIPVDMTNTGERQLVDKGEPVYTLFVAALAPGTATFEVRINDRWIPLLEGDTLFCGDCTPTLVGVLVRTTPALAGFFSAVIIGGTPDSNIQRG
jgi:hypothetical protein